MIWTLVVLNVGSLYINQIILLGHFQCEIFVLVVCLFVLKFYSIYIFRNCTRCWRQKKILELLGDLVSMISTLWDICGKITFNEDKIESVKESLFTCVYKQRSDFISKLRSSFTQEILDQRCVKFQQLEEIQ